MPPPYLVALELLQHELERDRPRPEVFAVVDLVGLPAGAAEDGRSIDSVLLEADNLEDAVGRALGVRGVLARDEQLHRVRNGRLLLERQLLLQALEVAIAAQLVVVTV